MSTAPICALPGCDNPVVRRPGQPGRPPIYCSPACRPSRQSCSNQVTVEIAQDDDGDGHGLHAARPWVVRLRRGRHSVIVARDLGRFSASVLYDQLRRLLHPRTGQEGDAIE